MAVFTWDHVQLRSRDPDAAAAWFARHLGAEVLRSPSRLAARLNGVDIFIAGIKDGDDVAAPPLPPYQGLEHFGLTVTDMDVAVAELRRDGVTFAQEPKTLRPGVRGCFIHGPDGIWIEILERKSS